MHELSIKIIKSHIGSINLTFAHFSFSKVVSKLGLDGIISTSVVLRVHKNPVEEKHSHTTKKDSQIAECTVVMKGGAIVHTSERSEDMYASIDLVSHKLAQKLRRHKEKVQDKRKNQKVQN